MSGRLEEIKKAVNHDLTHNDGMMISVSYTEVKWLIEQAGLVGDFDKLDDEYQKDISNAEAAKRSYKKQRDELKIEIERLREALKGVHKYHANCFQGELARKALEESK